MKSLKKRSPVSRASKKAREEQARAEKVHRARVKFDRLTARCAAICEYQYGPLVTDPESEDEEGEFEPEELALVPTADLYQGLTYLEETREILEELIRHVEEAHDARVE